jgi:phosphoketolase
VRFLAIVRPGGAYARLLKRSNGVYSVKRLIARSSRKNAGLLEGRQLPFRRTSLSSGQSFAGIVPHAGPYQTPFARALGNDTGAQFIYVHLNRLIKDNNLNMMYVIGPGHGGPGLVAQTYLEGSCTERYAAIEQSRNGLHRLFRQFSWPYGIPSHVSPETPGSIHEGGELGYSLAHANGAAFDNPDLIVTCIIGDGEAETGALAASWHSNKFLNPARDGAVLPILHLNGFKIANPTVLARISRQELTDLMRGYGYEPRFVEGDDAAGHVTRNRG